MSLSVKTVSTRVAQMHKVLLSRAKKTVVKIIGENRLATAVFIVTANFQTNPLAPNSNNLAYDPLPKITQAHLFNQMFVSYKNL
jgi:hypothetical protein